MDTTDHECPRLSNMVPGGRKELVKKPALPFGKSFPFLMLSYFISAFHLRISGWLVSCAFLLLILVVTGVQSPLLVD